jgi:MFS family permease
VIVAVSLCLVILHYGARVSFGVFFKPMLDDFNWTRALTSGSLTLSMLVQGSGAIIMGRLNDKLGPRNVMTICSILLGAGFLLMSWVHSPWQLYLFYGMIVGAGMGGAFVALLSTIARWFAKKRGLMAGVTISGIGLGTLVVSPAANRLISIYDWRIAYLILGGVILVSGAILSQFLRRDPARLGTAPQGNSDQLANPISPNAQGLTFREAIRTKQLWIIVITFFSLGYVIMSMNTHLVPNITDTGIPSNTAANIFAVSGIMGAAGCILIGTIADKIGNRRACIHCSIYWLRSMV